MSVAGLARGPPTRALGLHRDVEHPGQLAWLHLRRIELGEPAHDLAENGRRDPGMAGPHLDDLLLLSRGDSDGDIGVPRRHPRDPGPLTTPARHEGRRLAQGEADLRDASSGSHVPIGTERLERLGGLARERLRRVHRTRPEQQGRDAGRRPSIRLQAGHHSRTAWRPVKFCQRSIDIWT